jgi:putative FmdB family regulatory protein
MPIYEYQAVNPDAKCHYCRNGFELFLNINDRAPSTCAYCGEKVKKIISWCHSLIVETSQEHVGTKKKIKEYENSGMWSHAAELADTHAEKIKDNGLKIRALDNYKKAGYDSGFLSKHAQLKDD